jgi:hypothetical protein
MEALTVLSYTYIKFLYFMCVYVVFSFQMPQFHRLRIENLISGLAMIILFKPAFVKESWRIHNFITK